jgi:hypothetical protein
MKDGLPDDQFSIILERRHIAALAEPGKAKLDDLQDARQLLRGAAQHKPISNPREAGGKMIDSSGDPHAKGQVMFDSRRAVLLEEIEAAVVHTTHKGEPVDEVALVMSGRINRPPNMTGHRPKEKVSHLHFVGWGGAADIIVELQALAGRAGFDLRALLEEKWAHFEKEGWTR